MSKRIVIIQGHPDSVTTHFGHALDQAYARGAQQAGHSVKIIHVAQLNFELLRSEQEFEEVSPVADILKAQEAIMWAEHIVILYPLWLGDMPALLKGFLEQTLRPRFAMTSGERNGWPKKELKGRSAHIIVTMGMPGVIYRWFYCAHSLKSLKRNILSFCGIKPIRDTLIGSVDNLSKAQRSKWLQKMQRLGETGR